MRTGPKVLAAATGVLCVVLVVAVMFLSDRTPPTESNSEAAQQRIRELEANIAQLEATIRELRARDVVRMADAAFPVNDSMVPAPQPPTEVSSPKDQEPSARDLGAVAEWLRSLDPEEFGDLSLEEVRYMRKLDLGGRELTDADLQLLQAMDHLVELNIADNAITDAGLVHLAGMQRLESLFLNDNKISGWGLQSLQLTSLKHLELDDTQLGDAGLQWLAGLDSLDNLKLNRINLTDDGIYDLGRITSLRHIELDKTHVTDEGIARLLSMNPGLERLEVRSTAVTKEALRQFAKDYPHCTIALDSGLPFGLTISPR